MKRSFWMGIIGICILFTVLSSCSSTRLVSSWKAPEVTAQNLNKVLVIGLMGSRDRSLRENVENTIVKDLQAHGINAGSAYAEYGPKNFEGLDEKATLKRISDKGYDGTFTVALLDKTKEKQYVPPSVGIMPGAYRFWGYYRNIYTRVYRPGYYAVTNKFVLEANFYSLNPDKLIYSAQTNSSDPASPQTLATEFSKTLFEDMMHKGVLK